MVSASLVLSLHSEMNRRHLDRVTRAYLASARAFAPTQRTKGCASTKPLSHNPARRSTAPGRCSA
jgi:hypothetical protein